MENRELKIRCATTKQEIAIIIINYSQSVEMPSDINKDQQCPDSAPRSKRILYYQVQDEPMDRKEREAAIFPCGHLVWITKINVHIDS